MSASPAQLSLRRPDDWHVHLRDGALLQAVLPSTAAQFGRAIVMPNLSPPITTVAAAQAYWQRILAALPDGSGFTPLLTAYLTDTIDPAELERGFGAGVFTACKLYPANATTNSAAGVSDLAKLSAVFETLERIGMPLLIHGEVTDTEIDIFDREAVFIERHLEPLLLRHRRLKVAAGLWTFLGFQSIEPTNNAAERALRQTVIQRKISHGVHTTSDAICRRRLLTVTTTLRQQGRDIWECLELTWIAHHRGGVMPSLLPDR